MVKREAFNCSKCKQQCAPDFKSPLSKETAIGPTAIGLYSKGPFFPLFSKFCGACMKAGVPKEEEQLVKCGPEAHLLLNAISYLANVAPRDELKLLNFGKWNPKVCVICGTPPPLLTAFRGVECATCNITGSAEFDYFCTLLSGLSSSFLDVPYEAIKRQTTLSAKQFLFCSVCHGEATHFSIAGTLFCEKCKWADSKHIDSKMLWNLKQLIRCIPNIEDLALLTFSKWTPFRCGNCSIPFTDEPSRLPFYHSVWGVMRCGSCFESCTTMTGHPIRLQFVITASKKLEAYFNVAKLPLTRCYTEGPDEEQAIAFPETLRCACGRVDEVEQFFECAKCSSFGFCLACLYKNHWKHDVNKVKPLMLQAVVRGKAEKTMQTMCDWIKREKELDKEGSVMFRDVSFLLGEVFRGAYESEDDIHTVTRLLNSADLSSIQKDVDRMFEAKTKVVTKMRQFRNVLKKRKKCSEKELAAQSNDSLSSLSFDEEDHPC